MLNTLARFIAFLSDALHDTRACAHSKARSTISLWVAGILKAN
ncbi:MAG: hypothetical protein Q9M48_08900 [Rhodobacterales bacterium]|nr:hypothetical protein [Rhodobacterales bacterium]